MYNWTIRNITVNRVHRLRWRYAILRLIFKSCIVMIFNPCRYIIKWIKPLSCSNLLTLCRSRLNVYCLRNIIQRVQIIGIVLGRRVM